MTEDEVKGKLAKMVKSDEDIKAWSAQMTGDGLLAYFEDLTNMKNKAVQMHKIRDTLSYENVNKVTLTSARVQALMKDDGKIQTVLSKLIASQTDGAASTSG